MSIKWQYGDKCSVCGGEFGSFRCKGMCNSCYCKERKRTNPKLFKENRRVSNAKTNWDSPTYLGRTPASYDWARLAAFIDGEGNIGLSPRSTPNMKSLTLCGRVIVTNTNFALTVWCLDVFGMTFYAKRGRSERWKDCYYSQATGYRAAWVLRNCLEWFLLKRAQAEVVLEHQQSTKVGTWERGSGVTTPNNLLEYRNGLRERLHELNKRGPEPSQITERK